VTGNRSLSSCEAEELRDAIGVSNIGGIVDLSYNDDMGTCAP
jgi:hypothetical protein